MTAMKTLALLLAGLSCVLNVALAVLLVQDAKPSRAPDRTPAPVAAPGVAVAAPARPAESSPKPDQALQAALALRDELVAEGQSRYDELLSTGQAQHDELISTAQAKHDELISTGQSRHDELISTGTTKHDEMVSTATSQRDEMIGAATSKRDEMLTEARERSTGMVAEAQQKKASILEDLGRQRGLLERKIEELSGFERDYRQRLHTYIQGQLSELKTVGLDGPDDEAEGQEQAAAEPQHERQG